MSEPRDKGNGAPHDEGSPVRISVVDRRHHAQPGKGAAQQAHEARYPTVVEELKSRAEAAERRAREAMARAQAELDAVRERLQRDVERRVLEGSARLLGAVLEVVDNLDRAARAAASESKVVAEGLDLIRQQLLSLLKAEGVEPIETLGLEYDPHVAEAVTVEPVEEARHNLVLEEVRRGYRHHDAVLRPARVKVGKATNRDDAAG